MKTQNLNLFIVDDNRLMAGGLKKYINNFFGNRVNVSTFYTGDSCLQKFDEKVDVVVLDYSFDGKGGNTKNGLDILQTIKQRNPETDVIMLSSCDEMKVVAQSLKYGATDYIIKERNSWDKVCKLLSSNMLASIKRIIPEFSIKKYLLLFFAIFLTIGKIAALIT